MLFFRIFLFCITFGSAAYSMESSNSAHFRGEYMNLDSSLVEAAKAQLKDSEKHPSDRTNISWQAAHEVFHKLVKALAIGAGRTFNTSMVSHEKGFVLAVRVFYNCAANAPLSCEIIPGSNNTIKSEIGQSGLNFVWGYYPSNEKTISEGTLYFLADAVLKNFMLLFPDESTDPSWMERIDIRLSKHRENIFVASRDVKFAAQIYIDSHAGTIGFGETQLFRLPENNQVLLDANLETGKYLILDWINYDGLKFFSYDQKKNNYVIPQAIIVNYVDERYPILRMGSAFNDGLSDTLGQENAKIMPLFSFGGSSIKIDKNLRLGVGHIKIYILDRYSFKDGSRISIFRDELRRDFEKYFGERYIKHDWNRSHGSNNFHYLMYFWLLELDDNNQPIGMKISNSFLPIDYREAGDPKNYVFSLVFPMSVSDDPANADDIMIAAGVGDFSSVVMRLNKSEVISWCHHNILNLDMKYYHYKLMIFDEDSNNSICDRIECGQQLSNNSVDR